MKGCETGRREWNRRVEGRECARAGLIGVNRLTQGLRRQAGHYLGLLAALLLPLSLRRALPAFLSFFSVFFSFFTSLSSSFLIWCFFYISFSASDLSVHLLSFLFIYNFQLLFNISSPFSHYLYHYYNFLPLSFFII